MKKTDRVEEKCRKLITKAPGKLILSGEHAVVYGNPAIAIAVDRFAHTTLSWQSEYSNFITFHLCNLTYTVSSTLQKLRKLKRRAQRKYKQFLNGECTIPEVLQHSFDLLQYAFIHTIDKFNLRIPRGVVINTDSDIPIGCGMGSSAATIVSVMHAVASFLNPESNLDRYWRSGCNIENLQHGYSSGLDVYVSLHGGCVYFENQISFKREISKIPMYIVNTGKSRNSTGECVSYVRNYLKDNWALLRDFASLTKGFDIALQENNIKEIQECIKNNHALLKYIGVVPEIVQCFISDLEKVGSVAKVCGSGAITGDNAGIVLIIPNNEQEMYQIAKKYNYSVFGIKNDIHGTQII